MATLFAFASVNQRFPSRPTAMPRGRLSAVGTEYSVKTPAVVTLATRFPKPSVNQRFPSGPATMPIGLPLSPGTTYSTMVPTRVAEGDGTGEGVAGAVKLAAGVVEEAVGTESQPAIKMIKGSKPAARLMLLL